ncbi:MAG: DNA cytosine methyltransferase [Chromatiales bacterium]|nr:DNA cytosine methyltransferase [Chromatiales bacterium]
MRPTIIDLFSGCGGLGLGAELAGFRSLAAFDISTDLQSSLQLNFPETRAINADLGKVDASHWKRMFGDLRPDGIIGGPPCQGFSRIGRHDKNDPRNNLVNDYFRLVSISRPKFFVMENVEGILDDDNRPILDAALERLPQHYRIVGPLVVNAADYGAPTNRMRVVVVGYDPDEIDAIGELDIRPRRKINISVRDAIADLPEPVRFPRSPLEYDWVEYRTALQESSQFARTARSLPPRHLGWRAARDALAGQRVSGLYGTVHTESVIDRFSNTNPGKAEPISRYPRLAWDHKCPTLRAGTGSDRGSYQAMRPIHPDIPRVITVREAARLQGFPDWFVFHPTKWHSFRMIGNSVSPIMSRRIMSSIRKKLA